MIPAAVSDIRYRTVSLESCVAAVLVGCAVFVWWAIHTPIGDVLTSAVMTGGIALAAWFAGRYGGGDGDWWFVAGAVAALSTINPMVPAVAVMASMSCMGLCHVTLCVRRPGLPFPQRLYRHVKREGDKFRIDVSSGDITPTDASGMIVYPGLPLVAFLVPTTILVGLIL